MDALRQLHKAGHEIALSSIAVGELQAQAARAEKLGLLIGPFRKVYPYLKKEQPIAPGFPTLLQEILIDLEEGGDQAQVDAWNGANAELADMYVDFDFREHSDVFLPLFAMMDDYLKKNAEPTMSRFKASSASVKALLKKHTPDFAVKQLALVHRAHTAEDYGFPWMAEQHLLSRVDAHCRYHGWAVVNAAQTHGYETKKRENDIQDIMLLSQIARPSLVVTQDYRLIAGVDASKSVQSPWVTTLGELVEGLAPTCNPWGPEAFAFKQGFESRTVEELRARDSKLLGKGE